MIPVVWVTYQPNSINHGFWDNAELDRLFANALWRPASPFEFEHHDSFQTVPETARGVVAVIPGQHNAEHTQRLTDDLERFEWAVVVITGDEDALFDWSKIKHPKIKFWIMAPRPGREYPEGTRFFGSGPAPDAYALLPNFSAEASDRYLDFFFSGQVTHERRYQMVASLQRLPGGKLVQTPGFTQGLEHDEYFRLMASAKVIPCPSGPATADSFRFYEALEAGCVPIADDITPRQGDEGGYWERLYPDRPFPVIRDYGDLPGYIKDSVKRYPELNNRISAWWLRQKRRMAYELREDLIALGAVRPRPVGIDDLVTITIPVSPIISHPDPAILVETIESIRYHLPTAEIIITADGVRKEQENLRGVYEQFLQRVLWKAHREWSNVLVLINDDHTHQVGMARQALEYIQTPLLLYVEQDTPLVTDEPIDWEGLANAILSGDANVIRLAFEAQVLAEHRHMMLDDNPTDVNGVPLLRTAQWSSRPHLSSTAFYRHMLATYFSPGANCFIEDKVHGSLHVDFTEEGVMGWYKWRVWIYHPEGHIKRSYHTDGRAGQEKFDDKQVF